MNGLLSHFENGYSDIEHLFISIQPEKNKKNKQYIYIVLVIYCIS